MQIQAELQVPDDEYYYFGVELSHSPVDVKQRLLRKPEYIYSLTRLDEEGAGRTWLYLWRCNEDRVCDMWNLSSEELRAMECARQNMRLRVVLCALTEGEALNPAVQSHREALSYVLIMPRKSVGNKTIPQLNLGRATSSCDFTELRIVSSAELLSLFEDAVIESHEPDEVPQNVVDSHCLMYIRRALAVTETIHDADSMELLMPLREEYERFACDLLRYCEEYTDEVHHLLSELGKMEYRLMLRPWYAGCHHQRVTHPSGLVICESCPPGEYRRELLDFEPGRSLCYKRKEVGGLISSPGEEDEAMPQREDGRFHVLPDDCVCGPHVDAQGRVIRWVHM